MRRQRIASWRDALKRYLQGLDWSLLLFLLLLLNVKLYIKVAGIIFAVVIHRKTPFSFKKTYPEQRFYIAMMILALVNLLLSFPQLSFPSFFSFCLGCGYWLMAMMAAWHVMVFVREGDPEKVHRTIGFFFLLNALCVLGFFLRVCIEAGTLNPYIYEGEHRRYFISTGDRISGIGFDGSVTTAVTGAFGLLYFLYRDQRRLAILCMITVLLATSNFVDLLLICLLLFIFLFQTNRRQKAMVAWCFLLMIVFATKISPANRQYTAQLMGQAVGKHPYVDQPRLPHPKQNDFVEGRETELKRSKDSSLLRTFYMAPERDSIISRYKGWSFSGRWIAWEELGDFFRAHPGRLLFGAGMGNFSSRLAFRTAALGIGGGYPQQQRYIHPFFRDNYLFLYLYYQSRDEGQHSVINQPDSVYGQLLGEYGLAGLACFVLLYAAGFIRRSRRASYGLPLLLLLAAVFFTQYWFEQLSIVILFELLMLSDQTPNPGHAPLP